MSAFIKEDNIVILDPDFDDPITEKEIEELLSIKEKFGLIIQDNDNVGYKHPIDILANVPNISILKLINYKQKISKFPPNLIELETGDCFNQDIGEELPETLEKLTLGFLFNSKIHKYPPHLKLIAFGAKFNQPIDDLPPYLEKLYLCGDFCQRIDNLPDSLKFISMVSQYSCKFNLEIKSLPQSLEELYLPSYFNQSVDFLPPRLKILFLSKNFNKSLFNLPDGLIKLALPKGGFFNESINSIPDTIEELRINESYAKDIKKLPSNLVSLQIHQDYEYILNIKNILGNRFSEIVTTYGVKI